MRHWVCRVNALCSDTFNNLWERTWVLRGRQAAFVAFREAAKARWFCENATGSLSCIKLISCHDVTVPCGPTVVGWGNVKVAPMRQACEEAVGITYPRIVDPAILVFPPEVQKQLQQAGVNAPPQIQAGPLVAFLGCCQDFPKKGPQKCSEGVRWPALVGMVRALQFFGFQFEKWDVMKHVFLTHQSCFIFESTWPLPSPQFCPSLHHKWRLKKYPP